MTYSSILTQMKDTDFLHISELKGKTSY